METKQLEETVVFCNKKNACYENDGLCTLSADATDVPCEHFNIEVNGTQEIRDATRADGFRPAICYGCDYK